MPSKTIQWVRWGAFVCCGLSCVSSFVAVILNLLAHRWDRVPFVLLGPVVSCCGVWGLLAYEQVALRKIHLLGVKIDKATGERTVVQHMVQSIERGKATATGVVDDEVKH